MCVLQGKTVEVRVHAYFKGGLHASYAGMLVFIPWVYVKNGTFERTQVLPSTLASVLSHK